LGKEKKAPELAEFVNFIWLLASDETGVESNVGNYSYAVLH
jgi:hypothetical protein